MHFGVFCGVCQRCAHKISRKKYIRQILNPTPCGQEVEFTEDHLLALIVPSYVRKMYHKFNINSMVPAQGWKVQVFDIPPINQILLLHFFRKFERKINEKHLLRVPPKASSFPYLHPWYISLEWEYDVESEWHFEKEHRK